MKIKLKGTCFFLNTNEELKIIIGNVVLTFIAIILYNFLWSQMIISPMLPILYVMYMLLFTYLTLVVKDIKNEQDNDKKKNYIKVTKRKTILKFI